MPRVSVVVATFNRAALLPAMLDSLLAQDAADFEAICVDDGSTDETQAILGDYAGRHGSRLQVLRVANGGQGLARNAGAEAASGVLLLFTDDDCLLPPGWVRGMAAAYDRHACDALAGGFRPHALETRAERYLHYRGQVLFGDKAKWVDVAPAMNFMVPRELFFAVGGFIAEPLEDWVLCHRLRARGARIYYDPSVSVIHRYERDWNEVWRRVRTPAVRGIFTARERGMRPGTLVALSAAKFLTSPVWIPRHYPADLWITAWHMEAYFLKERFQAWRAWRRGEDVVGAH